MLTNFDHHIIGENDITLVTTQLRFLPGTIQLNIEFSLSVDNIAQELDETFVITLELPDAQPPCSVTSFC